MVPKPGLFRKLCLEAKVNMQLTHQASSSQGSRKDRKGGGGEAGEAGEPCQVHDLYTSPDCLVPWGHLPGGCKNKCVPGQLVQKRGRENLSLDSCVPLAIICPTVLTLPHFGLSKCGISC